MSNYFKSIFEKHLRNGTAPIEAMADDVGHLKGIVSIQPYNPVTLEKQGKAIIQNTVVNSSKSNVIRLISQGSSSWGDYANPTSLKISRMRFGNASSSNRQISNLFL